MRSNFADRWPYLGLAAGLVAILLIYSMAWSGTLHFDDEPNLNGLHGVTDFASALQYSLTGESGPTGRPLALATFAIQAAHWPDPRPFLVVNTLIHITNGLLCFLVLAKLLRWFVPERRQADWLAVGIALIWTASPFLASASLMVVQRMTGLSALFIFLSLWVYLVARERYRPDSIYHNLQLAVLIGAGTLLAGLSKESGFLLPVFLLLIERLLIPSARPKIEKLDRRLLYLVLVVPVLGILAYLASRGLNAAAYTFRDYGPGERLLTQPRVLWDYIRHLLIPLPAGVSPFHDNWQHSQGILSPLTTLPALIGLLVLGLASWALRKRLPVVTFGLLFFFGGHLLESTTISLELYFPHRNYVPALGLYLALGYLFYALAVRDAGWRKRAAASISAYLAVFGAVLLYGTTLWGNHMMAAEMWFIHKQDSVRAVQYLYHYYAGKGEVQVASQVNRLAIRNHPGNSMFTIQSLGICDDDEDMFEYKVQQAVEDLENERIISWNVAETLQQVSAFATRSDCPHLNLERAERLLDAAMSQPGRYVPARARQTLWMARAQIADQRDDYEGAIHALEQVLAIGPVLDAVLLIAYYQVERGEALVAIEFLEEILADPPVGFPQILAWRMRLEALLESLLPLRDVQTNQ